MFSYLKHFTALESEKDALVNILVKWSNINSYTENVMGLNLMSEALKETIAPLDVSVHTIPLPPLQKINSEGKLSEVPTGNALHFSKHPHAPVKILLSGHIDTVFPLSSPFQKAEKVNSERLRGPGVADMKGGLLVMLKSLQLLESSPWAGKVGWEVIINTDEEAGSRSSEKLIYELALRNHVGLVFEPAFPDGSLVKSRKGSVNYTLVARGVSAHAGRDFNKGRNAIVALAKIITLLEEINHQEKDITLNTGFITGGGPVNIVPDLCLAKINLRAVESTDFEQSKQKILDIVKTFQSEGIHLKIFELGDRVPKLKDLKHEKLFQSFMECGQELKLDFGWVTSGGVCDGNIMAEAGLPTLDSLGVVGGGLHTDQEYVLIDSIIERIKLTTLFLFKLANQEIILTKESL